MREAQNFFKHADQDPDAVLKWNVADTEAMIMAAIMNAGEFDGLSLSESVFQLWYIAKHRSIFTEGFEPLKHAAERFPNLDRMGPTEQRQFGERVLREQYDRMAADETISTW